MGVQRLLGGAVIKPHCLGFGRQDTLEVTCALAGARSSLSDTLPTLQSSVSRLPTISNWGAEANQKDPPKF